MGDTEDQPTELSKWDRNDEVARTLYAEYNARFLSDNNRIWTTGATMIPLSLGSFALLASIKEPTLAQVIALPLIGVCLMAFWEMIADGHRVFQDSSRKNCTTIEERLGLSYRAAGRQVRQHQGCSVPDVGPGRPRRGARDVLVARRHFRLARMSDFGHVLARSPLMRRQHRFQASRRINLHA